MVSLASLILANSTRQQQRGVKTNSNDEEQVVVETCITEFHVLFLLPTRELASQIEQAIFAIDNYMNIQARAGVGGKSKGADMRKLEYGVHAVSGTPCRVCDMIKRTLHTRAIELLVHDESDEMLTGGFKDQIYDVYRYLPPELQVVLISATLPNVILNIRSNFMTDPMRMLLKRDELTLEGIKQLFAVGEMEEWKSDTLCEICETHIITQPVNFCSTKQKVDWLSEKIRSNNFEVYSLHRDMPQKERDAILAEFRQTNTRVLIPTNVWACWHGVEQTTKTLFDDIDLLGNDFS